MGRPQAPVLLVMCVGPVSAPPGAGGGDCSPRSVFCDVSCDVSKFVLNWTERHNDTVRTSAAWACASPAPPGSVVFTWNRVESEELLSARTRRPTAHISPRSGSCGLRFGEELGEDTRHSGRRLTHYSRASERTPPTPEGGSIRRHCRPN